MSRNIDTFNEEKMIYKKILSLIVIGGLLFIGLITYGLYWAFFDTDRPTTDRLTEASPDKNETLKAFVSNGGVATFYFMPSQLVFNDQENKTATID
ncbi:DUF5412 family protein [Jeotgalibacillus soli]|uniref:Uncharacterized protein n=1 Tax=Jeotgalibacillus soli TaxID=889306 RepID=A0A0C2RHR9_9BACL|nr:DUF5412 family protein [Jeotgalibacillus soli]KIL49725.1 hypothetical protein KP78_11930 [Jeotgalibacillus soli]